MKIKFLSGVMLSSAFLFLFVLGTQGSFLSKAFINSNQSASVISSKQKENIYNISPSKEFPGAFNFNYVFEKKSSSSKEANFDLPIAQFDQTKAGNLTDFGPIRDAWGYPVKENAFMKQQVKETKKQSFLDSFKTNKAVAYDEDTENPGVYNCRANTSVSGYFKAYFEDIALGTNVGFDDPAFGEVRREEACQVLEDISELLMMGEGTVTPDILFTRGDTPLPTGSLAAATAYFGYYISNPDNGSLHKHIITKEDPTPGAGNFDAMILTNWSGVNWSVDSSLNQNTYDFYTTMYHEVLHTLGFRSSLPAFSPQTNTPAQYGTLDFFSYKDESLQDRFITATANLLNVPIGAPSPWFITNQVVYRGIKNILGAVPDGIHPVYSPTSWEQGSSLSHFDMGRADGEEYVMHPSIGTNTEREIHEHEKEVLCHLGYQVEGVDECESPTPVAVDDIISTDGPNCSTFSSNDYSLSGGDLSLNTFEILQSNPGDTLQYINGVNCNGSYSDQSGALSFIFTPSGEEGERLIRYTMIDSVTGRISFPAYITNTEDYCLDSSPENFICNGDFESGQLEQPSSTYYGQISPNCPSNIRPWCRLYGTVDIFDRVLSFVNPWVPQGPDTYNGAPNNRYLGGVCATSLCENAFTKTKTPLLPGEYSLSFYGIFAGQQNVSVDIYLTDVEPEFLPYLSPYTPLGSDIYIPVQVAPTISQVDESDWQEYVTSFSVPNNANDYQYLAFVFSNGYRYYLDDVVLTLQNSSSINGYVYQDANSDGVQQSLSEQGLSGAGVGLFQTGNLDPVQTTFTENIPNQGKYTFSNLPTGTYYVALIGESVYSQITEPEESTDPFDVYGHVHEVSISENQIAQNVNFGVTLGDVQSADILIKKNLIDSSLSVFDRYVTWRIRVGNIGSSSATNILISDILPPGLIYSSHLTQNLNETYDNTSGEYRIPDLNIGEFTYIDITTRVPNKACGTKTNTASLVSLNQMDVNLQNNQESASLFLRRCIPTALEGKF